MAWRSEDSDREGRKPEFPLGPGGGVSSPLPAGLASSVGCDFPDFPWWAWRTRASGGRNVNCRSSEPESEAWRGLFHVVQRTGMPRTESLRESVCLENVQTERKMT